MGYFKNGLKLSGVDTELAKKYEEIDYSWSNKDIIRLSNNLSSLYSKIRQFSDQYLLLEINLIKLLEFDSSIEIENFLKNEIAEDSKKSISEKKPIKKNRKETKKE